MAMAQPTIRGNLLTAEVTQFGFLNGAAGASDTFDLRLTTSVALWLTLYGSRFGASGLPANPVPNIQHPFNGSFNANWMAQAKGYYRFRYHRIGDGGCHLKLQAKCSVGGGPFQDKCRIKKTRSPKHWERCEYSHSGHIFQTIQVRHAWRSGSTLGSQLSIHHCYLQIYGDKRWRQSGNRYIAGRHHSTRQSQDIQQRWLLEHIRHVTRID